MAAAPMYSEQQSHVVIFLTHQILHIPHMLKIRLLHLVNKVARQVYLYDQCNDFHSSDLNILICQLK
jgi:hypothetical protein